MPMTPGGRHQNGIFRNAQNLGCFLCGLFTVAHALLASAGVGNTGIYDDCLGIGGFLYDFLIPFHRGRLDQVGGEGARRMAGFSLYTKAMSVRPWYLMAAAAAAASKPFAAVTPPLISVIFIMPSSSLFVKRFDIFFI